MEIKNTSSRRDFMKTTTAGLAGAAVLSAASSSRVLGANEKIRVAVMGTNSRGSALAQEFAKAQNSEVAYICDVDSRVVEKTVAQITKIQGNKPKGTDDVRKALDKKDVDVLVIAAPDHWHAPATVMALKAGKHVYVEKPCGHNPREGELLIQAQKKYKKIVQMGNQQRSSPHTIQAMQELKEGKLGRPYFGRAWYANARGPIGRGTVAPVPEWLNWELWQGPAPRVDYRDNVVHYNWHWFRRWGTGESCNNATHEVDVCRWALEVGYPVKASSSGGRFHYDDDWEFYDTQMMSFEFEGKKMISWEGRSCNKKQVEGRGRGSDIFCTDGTLVIDRNGYVMYDKNNKEIKKVDAGDKNATMDTSGAGGSLNGMHIANFLDAIRTGAQQNSPIDEGHKSVLLCHLANISQEVGRTLDIDPRNGRIVNDAEAMKMWDRDYEPGWELTV